MIANVEYHNRLIHRWVITLDEPGEWPNQTKHYGGRQEFVPMRLSFSAESENGGPLKSLRVTITGPRVLKSGLGMYIGEDYYNPRDLPEWALKLVEGFTAQV
jgi:hypothetical protein